MEGLSVDLSPRFGVKVEGKIHLKSLTRAITFLDVYFEIGYYCRNR